MKNTAKPASRPEISTYRGDRGELLTFSEFEAALLKSITKINESSGFAAGSYDSTPKHLCSAKAKGYIERMFARLNLHQESLHEDSK